MTAPWIYHRQEGSHVVRWRLGWQWWHGLNLFWRTDHAIYVFGWGGHGWSRRDFTFADFKEQQAFVYGTIPELLDEHHLSGW